MTSTASYGGDITLGTQSSGPANAVTNVVKATTTATLTASAAPDANNAVQLGRAVTLTATALTLNNGSGDLVGPSGTFTFTLPAGTFALPNCGAQVGNSFTVNAGNIMVTTPYNPAGGNQGSATATCSFYLTPASTAVGAGVTDNYSVTYNGDTLTLASPAAARVSPPPRTPPT